jgi:large subunit ribosomal protein L15
MSLGINTIKPASGSKQKRKRIGRGNGSGVGTYSGKGLKGQKSRSGVSGLKRLGMRQNLLKIPKLRGFKSLQEKNCVINIDLINKIFKDNDEISPKTLFEKKLIKDVDKKIKILGRGDLKLKGLQFKNVKMSESVKKVVSKRESSSS